MRSARLPTKRPMLIRSEGFPGGFPYAKQAEDLIENRGFCEGPCFGDGDIANYLSENGYSPGPITVIRMSRAISMSTMWDEGGRGG